MFKYFILLGAILLTVNCEYEYSREERQFFVGPAQASSSSSGGLSSGGGGGGSNAPATTTQPTTTTERPNCVDKATTPCTIAAATATPEQKAMCVPSSPAVGTCCLKKTDPLCATAGAGPVGDCEKGSPLPLSTCEPVIVASPTGPAAAPGPQALYLQPLSGSSGGSGF